MNSTIRNAAGALSRLTGIGGGTRELAGLSKPIARLVAQWSSWMEPFVPMAKGKAGLMHGATALVYVAMGLGMPGLLMGSYDPGAAGPERFRQVVYALACIGWVLNLWLLSAPGRELARAKRVAEKNDPGSRWHMRSAEQAARNERWHLGASLEGSFAEPAISKRL